MFKVPREKRPFQIGKHYMIMIIELQKKKKIHVHIGLLQLMTTLKRDIINIIQPIIEQKEHNILEFMEIIPSKNFSYMISLKFIALIIK